MLYVYEIRELKKKNFFLPRDVIQGIPSNMLNGLSENIQYRDFQFVFQLQLIDGSAFVIRGVVYLIAEEKK